MDQIHRFSSWVHGIVDHSPLILWSVARILLKWKCISNLILALHLRADGTHQTQLMGRRIGLGWHHLGGLTGASLLSSPRHDDVGFLGQNDTGVDGILTQDATRWGTVPRCLMVKSPLLQAWTTVSGGSGALPPSRSSSTPSSWPPLASPGDELARAAAEQWRTMAARVWFVWIKIRGI
jgi:hypothetical protein